MNTRPVTTVLFVVMLLGVSLPAQSADFSPFLGSFEGQARIVGEDQNTPPRDVTVEIEKHKKGFTISWATTKTSTSGKKKKKEYSIDFLPTDRKGIYAAGQKVNVFGGRKPLDPLKGDPYLWARIRDNQLTIVGLLILDTGVFELFSYHRTLLDQGNTMDLHYHRIKEGSEGRPGEEFEVKGTLTRSAD